ncbi:ABC transporter ATP-binding protein [Enterococcus gallinarum]|uniref:ABC transporter ATP-binding protein n=1 Tax=Enterococcus gallinarum TaxID=1353 RepID=UPI001C110555|nr:ABC transporter ATP-binding protein [Enterococcus gallinarum]MBU5358725.1 ABC transporter ATP-binding protein [Enterococcus gallinarum]
MKKMIDVKHLTKTYGTRFNQTKVLDNLSFSVDQGEFVGIMGPSGAGKTTLMNILSSILRPSLGSVAIGAQEITRLSENELSDFRRKEIGFIFQDFNLLDTLTAKDNIILPLAIDRLSVNEVDRRLAHLANLLGIAHLLDRYPEELSVGQKQRVAAARAIISRPSVLFADEPTGSLDSKAATELLRYLAEINLQEDMTILMVTHDPFTASYCNRILFIRDGVFFAEVVKKGSRKEFFEKIIDMQATIGGGDRHAL